MQLLEQHTRDTEEARLRNEAARQRVADVLNRRLLGKVLPRSVVQFLQQAWSQVLLLASLKHGEQSVQWQAGLRTLDELIWSVEPARRHRGRAASAGAVAGRCSRPCATG